MGNWGRRLLNTGLFFIVLSSSILASERSQIQMTSMASKEWIRLLLEQRDLFSDLQSIPDLKMDEIQSAECKTNILRPENSKPLQDAENQVSCEILSLDQRHFSFHFSLKSENIFRWGTRSETLPFTIEGSNARRLFSAFKKTILSRGRDNPMLYTSLDCSDWGMECVESFVINQEPDKLNSPLAIACRRQTEFNEIAKAKFREIAKNLAEERPDLEGNDFLEEFQKLWMNFLGTKTGFDLVQDGIDKKLRTDLGVDCLWLN